MTKEQIEQKKRQYLDKMHEVRTLYKELAEAGAVELSEEDLEQTAGGRHQPVVVQDPPPVL